MLLFADVTLQWLDVQQLRHSRRLLSSLAPLQLLGTVIFIANKYFSHRKRRFDYRSFVQLLVIRLTGVLSRPGTSCPPPIRQTCSCLYIP